MCGTRLGTTGVQDGSSRQSFTAFSTVIRLLPPSLAGRFPQLMGCDPQAPAVMASAWPPSLVRNGDAAPLASWSVDSAGTPPSPAIHTNMEFGDLFGLPPWYHGIIVFFFRGPCVSFRTICLRSSMNFWHVFLAHRCRAEAVRQSTAPRGTPLVSRRHPPRVVGPVGRSKPSGEATAQIDATSSCTEPSDTDET